MRLRFLRKRDLVSQASSAEAGSGGAGRQRRDKAAQGPAEDYEGAFRSSARAWCVVCSFLVDIVGRQKIRRKELLLKRRLVRNGLADLLDLRLLVRCCRGRLPGGFYDEFSVSR